MRASKMVLPISLFIVLPTCKAGETDGLKRTLSSSDCATGANCIAVTPEGLPDQSGTFWAQCSGRFADFVDTLPSGFTGRRFKLSQDYPASANPPQYPWHSDDFRTPSGSVQYLTKVRDYVYEGMEAADWFLEDNTVRRWYHVPWMHVGRHPREFRRGLTEERPLVGPELGIKPGVTVANWAVGFYNDVGAVTIGEVWKSGGPSPDATKAQASEGTVVAKLLFSTASAADFAGDDILDGAPEWEANVFVSRGSTVKVLRRLRLLQIDVALRDSRAGATGWIFGTYAYDRANSSPNPYLRMVPVGLMWGNDPSLTLSQYQSGRRAAETIVNGSAPAYARNHLGLAGRMNGPVDNPLSSCLSCHSTAQTPSTVRMTAFSSCSETQALHWFRNLPGSSSFGAVDAATCVPTSAPGPEVSLDYSLQQAVAFQTALDSRYHNPCDSTPKAGVVESRAIAPELMKGRVIYPVER
jgi:hypothetical protein